MQQLKMLVKVDLLDRYIKAMEPILSRVRRDVSAIKNPDGNYAWTSEPLTDQRLRQHLTGGSARGVAPMNPGESTTRLALLDFDSHRGETKWGDMTDVASKVIDALAEAGYSGIPFRSTGGRGIHVYLIWDQPQDAHSVRHELERVIGRLGFKPGTNGVAQKQIEIFPKQDEVRVGGYGNQFILPLAGKSEPLDHLFGLMPMGQDYALLMQWPTSAPVPVVTAPPRPERSIASGEPEDIEIVRSALMAIPNDDSRHYDDWFPVVCAVHEATGGSEAGRELAIEWSQRAPKFDLKFFEKRVWPHITPADGRPKAATRATLFHKAFENGWQKPTSAAGMTDEVEQVSTVLPAFSRTKSGNIKNSKTNLVAALRSPAACGFRIRYDAFTAQTLLAEQGADEWRPLREEDYTQISMNLERWGFGDLSKDARREGVQFVAAGNQFDSAQDWLNGLRWDGICRVETFAQRYLGAIDTPYHRAISRYMWTALAGRVLSPGCKADMVPILVGPQGVRKSTSVKAICPHPDQFTEIDLGTNDGDMARLLRARLVAELGELRGMSVRDELAVNALITRTHESWVPKYQELAVNFPRRFLFVGTSNRRDFLRDPTGARRWLPFDVGMCDSEAIARDRDQLWAEGAAIFHEHGVIFADAERLARGEHEKFSDQDEWQSLIETYMRTPDPFTGEALPPATGGEILRSAVRLPDSAHTPQAQARLKNIMLKLGATQENKRVDGVRARRYVLPNVEQ